MDLEIPRARFSQDQCEVAADEHLAEGTPSVAYAVFFYDPDGIKLEIVHTP